MPRPKRPSTPVTNDVKPEKSKLNKKVSESVQSLAQNTNTDQQLTQKQQSPAEQDENKDLGKS